MTHVTSIQRASATLAFGSFTIIIASLLSLALTSIASADTLTRQLELGMQGSDVSSLQTYLATDATLYPQGLVTGYFGSLTKSAVSNFQARYGIPTVGRVGPATLTVLNAKMGGGVVVIPSGTLTRSLSLGMRGADVSILQTFLARDNTIYPQGLVSGYYGSLTASAVSNYQARNSMTTTGIVNATTLALINSQIGGSVASTYGAPIIRNVSVSVGRTNATVNWNTNENARGVVYYSTTPLVTYENEYNNTVTVSGATALTDTNVHTSQSIVLSNLLANTDYYYLNYTTDQDGNVSVTWPASFRTTN